MRRVLIFASVSALVFALTLSCTFALSSHTQSWTNKISFQPFSESALIVSCEVDISDETSLPEGLDAVSFEYAAEFSVPNDKVFVLRGIEPKITDSNGERLEDAVFSTSMKEESEQVVYRVVFYLKDGQKARFDCVGVENGIMFSAMQTPGYIPSGAVLASSSIVADGSFVTNPTAGIAVKGTLYPDDEREVVFMNSYAMSVLSLTEIVYDADGDIVSPSAVVSPDPTTGRHDGTTWYWVDVWLDSFESADGLDSISDDGALGLSIAGSRCNLRVSNEEGTTMYEADGAARTYTRDALAWYEAATRLTAFENNGPGLVRSAVGLETYGDSENSVLLDAQRTEFVEADTRASSDLLAVEDGIIRVRMQNGWDLRISGLPIGVKYKITSPIVDNTGNPAPIQGVVANDAHEDFVGEPHAPLSDVLEGETSAGLTERVVKNVIGVSAKGTGGMFVDKTVTQNGAAITVDDMRNSEPFVFNVLMPASLWRDNDAASSGDAANPVCDRAVCIDDSVCLLYVPFSPGGERPSAVDLRRTWETCSEDLLSESSVIANAFRSASDMALPGLSETDDILVAGPLNGLVSGMEVENAYVLLVHAVENVELSLRIKNGCGVYVWGIPSLTKVSVSEIPNVALMQEGRYDVVAPDSPAYVFATRSKQDKTVTAVASDFSFVNDTKAEPIRARMPRLDKTILLSDGKAFPSVFVFEFNSKVTSTPLASSRVKNAEVAGAYLLDRTTSLNKADFGIGVSTSTRFDDVMFSIPGRYEFEVSEGAVGEGWTGDDLKYVVTFDVGMQNGFLTCDNPAVMLEGLVADSVSFENAFSSPATGGDDPVVPPDPDDPTSPDPVNPPGSDDPNRPSTPGDSGEPGQPGDLDGPESGEGSGNEPVRPTNPADRVVRRIQKLVATGDPAVWAALALIGTAGICLSAAASLRKRKR